jgi:hypothetical protein
MQADILRFSLDIRVALIRHPCLSSAKICIQQILLYLAAILGKL